MEQNKKQYAEGEQEKMADFHEREMRCSGCGARERQTTLHLPLNAIGEEMSADREWYIHRGQCRGPVSVTEWRSVRIRVDWRQHSTVVR